MARSVVPITKGNAKQQRVFKVQQQVGPSNCIKEPIEDCTKSVIMKQTHLLTPFTIRAIQGHCAEAQVNPLCTVHSFSLQSLTLYVTQAVHHEVQRARRKL